MCWTQPLGQQHLDLLAAKFVALEAEQDFRLPVDVRNYAAFVGDDQSIWAGVKQLANMVCD
jgi:hypothetical protein